MSENIGDHWFPEDPAPTVRPMQGDIAVVPVAGDVGRLIRLGQWLNGDGFKNYEHAEVFIDMADVQNPRGYTLSAYPGGARVKPVPVDQEGWLWSTGRIPLTDEQRRLIVANAMACKGIPYGWEDYPYLVALRLHIPAPGSRSYMESPRHLICSQLCDYMYLKAGVHLFADGRLPGAVTPEDLANVILSHGRGVVYA